LKDAKVILVNEKQKDAEDNFTFEKKENNQNFENYENYENTNEFTDAYLSTMYSNDANSKNNFIKNSEYKFMSVINYKNLRNKCYTEPAYEYPSDLINSTLFYQDNFDCHGQYYSNHNDMISCSNNFKIDDSPFKYNLYLSK
jgi:hypothetical protein